MDRVAGILTRRQFTARFGDAVESVRGHSDRGISFYERHPRVRGNCANGGCGDLRICSGGIVPDGRSARAVATHPQRTLDRGRTRSTYHDVAVVAAPARQGQSVTATAP